MVENMESVTSASDCSNQETKTEYVETPFDYDDILNHLGQMGKYQLHTVLWLCLASLFPGIVVMSYTFTGGVPYYRCHIDGCDGENFTEPNQFIPTWLNNTVPWSDNDTPDQCNRYNYTWTNFEECQNSSIPLYVDSITQCEDWIYDTTLFTSTIVSEYDLTCENEWKQTFASTIYMFGMLFGAVTLGNLADSFGRRLIFTVNVLVLGIVTTSLAFSPNFVTFCVLRFFSGISANGHFLILVVWGVESVGKDYRILCGAIYQIGFTVGSAILGLIAYYVRDWKTLQLIISVPMLALILIYWIVPESIRWLIVKKRYLEARRLIQRVADMNKKSVPKDLIAVPEETYNQTLSQLDQTINSNESSTPRNGNETNSINFIGKKETIIDVFRTPVLLRRLVIMSLAWIAAIMGYYGITFSATNLSDDFYLNYELAMQVAVSLAFNLKNVVTLTNYQLFVIAALITFLLLVVEIPAYLGGIFVMNKLGRRPTLSGGLIIGGVACLLTGVLPAEPAALRLTFSMIGKLFISCVTSVVYSFTLDLFPTPARSAAAGLCSTCGRIGGILAPIIANFGRTIDPALPFIIFAGVNITVGLLCLFLPETREIALPNTVKEALEMEKYTISCLQRKKKTSV